jgi:predicted PurR-regulated permease PerM
MPTDDSSPPRQAAKAALALLALLLTALGVWTLHRYLPALIWAAILAIAVWPLYQRAARRWPPGKHNIVLPALFTLALALVFILPLVLLAIQVGHEVHGFYDAITRARSEGIPPPQWLAHLPVGGPQATSWWEANLTTPGSANALLQKARAADFMSNSRELGANIAHRMVLFGFTLLTLFFLFRDGEALAAQMRRAANRAFGPAGERIGRQIVASVHGTLDGLVLVGLGEGAILGVGYLCAGVPHPTLFGLVTAVAAMVPFGAALLFGAAALILLTQGSVAWAVGILVLGFVTTFVADHFVRPTLIGGATRLPFLWVLLGILGGVETWGLLGLFLGPAIMAALILLWREWTGAASE